MSTSAPAQGLIATQSWSQIHGSCVCIAWKPVSSSSTGDDYTSDFDWPTSRLPVDLSHVSGEARQWVGFCLSTNQENTGSESELCDSAIMHGMQGTSTKKLGVLLPKQAL
jgi:hypothetical protein